MKSHEAQKLIDTIKSLVTEDRHHEPARGSKGSVEYPNKAVEAATEPSGHQPPSTPAVSDNFEQLYQRIIQRWIREAQVDPMLAHLTLARPELVVDVERRTMTLKGETLKGRIAVLISEGWLDTPRTHTEVKKELIRRGSDPGGNLGPALQGLKIDGFLVELEDGWCKAPGVKITKNEVMNG